MSKNNQNPVAKPGGVYQFPDTLRCPQCEGRVDGSAATDNSDTMPRAGDVLMCVYCEQISRFAKSFNGWHLVPLSARQITELDPEIHEEFEKLRPRLAAVWGPLGTRLPH